MSLESDLVSVIKTLCDRVFPDVAPADTEQPYVTYQQIGGDPSFYLDGTVMADRHAVVQIDVWDDRRLQATALMLAIEEALLQAPAIQAEPTGALRAAYDDMTERRGAQQDFSIWATR